jgi:DNA polymerase III subunit beta
VMPVVDGLFPPYERLLPTTSVLTVDFDVAELTEAVRRVRLIADRPQIPLHAEFTDSGEIMLLAGDSGTDAGVSEVVSCVVDGTLLKTSFNTGYLGEALDALDGETARMRFTDAVKPILLSVIGDESYAHLLMPVRS